MRISGRVVLLVVGFSIALSGVALACHSNYFNEVFTKLDQQSLTSDQLEQLMNTENSECRVRVVNGGVPGTNSVQHYHLLRRAFDRVKPQVVLLMYVMNDAEPLCFVPNPPSYVYRHYTFWTLGEARDVFNRATGTKFFEVTKPRHTHGLPNHGGAEDVDVTGLAPHQPERAAHQDRLADPTGAEDRSSLARRDLEAHTPERVGTKPLDLESRRDVAVDTGWATQASGHS